MLTLDLLSWAINGGIPGRDQLFTVLLSLLFFCLFVSSTQPSSFPSGYISTTSLHLSRQVVISSLKVTSSIFAVLSSNSVWLPRCRVKDHVTLKQWKGCSFSSMLHLHLGTQKVHLTKRSAGKCRDFSSSRCLEPGNAEFQYIFEPLLAFFLVL